MQANPTIIGPSRIDSLQIVTYTLQSDQPGDLLLDETAVITLIRVLDDLVPRSGLIEAICGPRNPAQLEACDLASSSAADGTSQKTTSSHRLFQLFCVPMTLSTGASLYRVPTDLVTTMTEHQRIQFSVIYMPASDFDKLSLNVQAYIQSQRLLERTFDVAPFCALPAAPTMPSSESYIIPVEGLFDPLPSMSTVTNARNFDFATQAAIETASGFPTPQSELSESELDQALDDLDANHNNASARALIPTSQFTIAEIQSQHDDRESLIILDRFKVLAVDQSPKSTKRYSIASERKAMQTMTIEMTFNIGQHRKDTQGIVKTLFDRYDHTDEDGLESFQRTMLMVVIRLLRHRYLNEESSPGHRQKPQLHPTGYANNFDDFIPKKNATARYVAIRNEMSMISLLDKLPMSALCHWIATGKVSEHVNTCTRTRHQDLQHLHMQVLLPLLYTASQRVPKEMHLLSGTLLCDEEKCLHAIVPHNRQEQYYRFLAGQVANKDWDRGIVTIDQKLPVERAKAEQSIARDQRTFRLFEVDKYSGEVVFAGTPPFLDGSTLSMLSD